MIVGSSTPWFEIEQDGAGRLRLRGELDVATAPQLQACLSTVEGDVEVDCGAVTFIDLDGLRVLVTSQRCGQDRGTNLRIVNPSSCVVRLLGLTGFDTVLDVRTESSAL